MSQLIRRLTSLSNFKRAHNPKGQIATVLILVTVLLLVFVLVTVNIGKVSTDSTIVANAADSAALMLGSQLSTKARTLYESLHNKPEVCQKGGFLALILAIVVAIIAVVITLVTYGGASPLLVMAIGAAAGAAGGAIGGAVAGTGAAQGAMTGAMIGAAIGSLGAGIYALAAAPATVPASGGVAGAATSAAAPGGGATIVSSAGVASSVAPGTFVAGGSTVIGGSVISGGMTVLPAVMSTTSAIGAVALGTLSVASSVYNESEAQSQTAQAQQQIADMMNKLSEPDRIRESVLETGLAQVVDDPNKRQDVGDANLNSNTEEVLSDFEIFYLDRLSGVTQATSHYPDYTRGFFDNGVTPFLDSVRSVIGGLGGAPGALEKGDYVLDANGNAGYNPSAGNYSRDGSIVKLLRLLWNDGTPHPFKAYINESQLYGSDDPAQTHVLAWEPGPTPEAINDYTTSQASLMNSNCDDNGCTDYADDPNHPSPAGYDYVDAMGDQLSEMASFMEGLKTRSVSQLAQSWNNWLPLFYDTDAYNAEGAPIPGTTPDRAAYYEQLHTDIDLLTQLENQMINIRDHQIPACHEGWFGPYPSCLSCTTGGPIHCYIDFVWPCPTDPTSQDGCSAEVCECGNCAQPPLIPCHFTNNSYAYTQFHHLATTDTVNGDAAIDGFADAISDIDNLIAAMSNFRSAIQDFAVNIQRALLAGQTCTSPGGCCSTAMSSCGSVNCVEYCWTDTRGPHSVKVEAGPYKIPYIKKKKTGNFLMNKTCYFIYPEGWRHGGSNIDNTDSCWVRVIRRDPQKDMGTLGTWNLFSQTISKRAKIYYKWDNTGLK